MGKIKIGNCLKKMLSFNLILTLILSVFVMPVSASETVITKNINRRVETNDTDIITKYGNIPYIASNNGNYQVFEISVSENGVYELEIFAGCYPEKYGIPMMDISVYNSLSAVYEKRLGSAIVTTGSSTNFANQTLGYLQLTSGTHKIKFEQKYGDIYFSSFTLTKKSSSAQTVINAVDYKETTIENPGTQSLKFLAANSADYDISSLTAGYYAVMLDEVNNYSANEIGIYADDVLLINSPLKKTSTSSHRTHSVIGTIKLSGDAQVITLRHTGSVSYSFTVYSITLVPIDGLSAVSVGENYNFSVSDAINGTNASLTKGKSIHIKALLQNGTYMLYYNDTAAEGAAAFSVNGRQTAIVNNKTDRIRIFDLNGGEADFEIKGLSGSFNVDSLYLIRSDMSQTELNNLAASISAAKSTNEAAELLNANKSIIPDYDFLMSDVFSRLPIDAEIYGNDYKNAERFLNAFYACAYSEKENPQIKLKINGQTATKLSDGVCTLDVKTAWIPKTGTVSFAIYENNSLYAFTFANYTGIEDLLQLKIKNSLVLDETKTYTYKLFYWDSFIGLKPQEGGRSIYREFYVNPVTGDDSASGTKMQPLKTIDAALLQTASVTENMSGNININLMPGDYMLSEAINIGTELSGKNGYSVVIKAEDDAQKPIIHGGKRVTGFSDADGDGIYEATVSRAKGMRNLYINDIPAIKAKSEYAFRCTALDAANTSIIASSAYFPEQISEVTDLELVWHATWNALRLPVTSLTRTAQNVSLKISPAIFERNNVNFNGGFAAGKLFYLENALELLDNPGEFYFDKAKSKLYYYPRNGEDLSTAEIYYANTEGLLNISGNDSDNKIQNIKLENLIFRFGAWDYVTEKGLMAQQSDCIYDIQTGGASKLKLPAQITVNYAKNIKITDCEFSCLGSSAINLENDVADSEISNNIISDISGAGITLGSFEHETNTELACSDILIEDNFIRRAAIEYRGCVGIAFYYDRGITIRNNSILDLPYTGISGGWGWGAEVGNAGDNKIYKNRLENIMSTLSDGGGVYLLGKQKNTSVAENAVLNNNGKAASGLYPDQGASFIFYENNLLLGCGRFATLSPKTHTNNFIKNYSDTTTFYAEDAQYNGFETTITVAEENLPEAAIKIKNNSGVKNHTAIKQATELPQGANSIIYLTPKKTYGFGTIYEAEDYIDGKTKTYEGYGGYIGMEGKSFYTEYLIDVEKAGNYRIGVYSASANSSNGTLDVLINGQTVLSGATVYSTGNWTWFEFSNLGTITLPEETITLTLKCMGGSYHLESFGLEYAE